MKTEIPEAIHTKIEELKTLRDEVLLHLHLAGKDLKDEWEKLEKRFPSFQRSAEGAIDEVKHVTSEAVTKLVAEARQLRDRLKSTPKT